MACVSGKFWSSFFKSLRFPKAEPQELCSCHEAKRSCGLTSAEVATPLSFKAHRNAQASLRAKFALTAKHRQFADGKYGKRWGEFLCDESHKKRGTTSGVPLSYCKLTFKKRGVDHPTTGVPQRHRLPSTLVGEGLAPPVKTNANHPTHGVAPRHRHTPTRRGAHCASAHHGVREEQAPPLPTFVRT